MAHLTFEIPGNLLNNQDWVFTIAPTGNYGTAMAARGSRTQRITKPTVAPAGKTVLASPRKRGRPSKASLMGNDAGNQGV